MARNKEKEQRHGPHGKDFRKVQRDGNNTLDHQKHREKVIARQHANGERKTHGPQVQIYPATIPGQLYRVSGEIMPGEEFPSQVLPSNAELIDLQTELLEICEAELIRTPEKAIA